MAQDWVTLPIEQLVTGRDHGALRSHRCAICGMRTVPGTDQSAAEQIRIHLERHHEALAETQTERASARLRKKLVKMGWTPPADDALGPPDSSDRRAPSPETPGKERR